jgi:hypothetical protein
VARRLGLQGFQFLKEYAGVKIRQYKNPSVDIYQGETQGVSQQAGLLRGFMF